MATINKEFNLPPVLEAIATSVRMKKPTGESGYERERLPLPVEGEVHPDGRSQKVAPIDLWYRRTDGVGLEPLIRKIASALASSGHAQRRFSALIVLALASIQQQRRGISARDSIGSLLSGMSHAQAAIWYALPVVVPKLEKCGRFVLGPIDYADLRARCDRAGSNYARLWGPMIVNGLGFHRWACIYREPQSVVLLDLQKVPEGLTGGTREGAPVRQIVDRLSREYYSDLALREWDAFWEQLAEDRDLLVAMGAEPLNTRMLRMIPAAQGVCIFERISGRDTGWVAPQAIQTSFSVSWNVHEPLQLELTESLQVKVPLADDSEFAKTAQTFGRFVRRAKEHFNEDRRDEAFLHLIISLDLLFGERDKATISVTDRAAVATHIAAGRVFEEQVKELKTLYDHRSRYVHQGASVPEDAYEEAKKVCEEVIRTLLRARLSFAAGTRADWLKKLDFFAAARRAGENLADIDFMKAGIRIAKSWGADSNDVLN